MKGALDIRVGFLWLSTLGGSKMIFLFVGDVQVKIQLI